MKDRLTRPSQKLKEVLSEHRQLSLLLNYNWSGNSVRLNNFILTLTWNFVNKSPTSESEFAKASPDPFPEFLWDGDRSRLASVELEPKSVNDIVSPYGRLAHSSFQTDRRDADEAAQHAQVESGWASGTSQGEKVRESEADGRERVRSLPIHVFPG